MAERIFRMFSLAFLSIGFVVAVAGADRDGPQDLANATSDLIQHVSAAHDANAVNGTPTRTKGISLTDDSKYLAQAQTPDDSPLKSDSPQKAKAQNPQNLPALKK